ncbi:HflX-like GTP-binding protein [Streptomyces werraensis]|uniref:HflX-like GTP-binding protein n=1 Tax=Streptomyces werraensis TaxID=68284 RepID=UPI0036A70DDC
MHQPRRHDRRPSRRKASAPVPPLPPYRLPATGADVVLVGFFSAKQKDFETVMVEAAARLAAHGARVVARIVQRRGVSSGGVRRMDLPYSSRTLLSHGKAREVAHVADRADAEAVVFANPLTQHQRRALTTMFGRPTVGVTDILFDLD